MPFFPFGPQPEVFMFLQRNVNGKRLDCGYTTGSCAAAAAKAAALMLLGEPDLETISLDTPKGVHLVLGVLDPVCGPDFVCCGVRKDSGDDPDVTHGTVVCAQVRLAPAGIHIDGGEGVGRVTRPGLDQPVGAAAINSTPRRMIGEALLQAAAQRSYDGGFSVVISVPNGAELASKTFNPRLGIEGGISILGTTGIVEPMSHQALADTVRVEVRQRAAAGARAILLTPGNYGETFAVHSLHLALTDHVSCSNFLGEALDACAEHGIRSILVVGHIGKLVKLGIGILNTHSAYGDGRMETLTACALEAGADADLLRAVLDSVTTDAALALLKQAGRLTQTMAVLGERIGRTLTRRVPVDVKVGFVCFTKAEGLAGVLCQSENAEQLLSIWRNTR